MIKESYNPIEPTNWPHPIKSSSLKRYHPKGAAKPCFMNYSGVVIVLFNTIYVSLHFLPILLWCAK